MRRRWGLAVLVVLGGGACEADPGAARREPTPAAATVVEVPVVADFAVAEPSPDHELTTVRSEWLRAGDGAAAIIAVRRPPTPSRCIADARLRLFVRETSGAVAEELAVYPSHVFNAARKTDGDAYGYAGSLLDVRPRATYEDAGGGWSEWRVTAIVRRWLSGRAFPSLRKTVPERGPVVFALRDVEGAEPLAAIEVTSAEGDEVPHMVVSVLEGCVSRGRA